VKLTIVERWLGGASLALLLLSALLGYQYAVNQQRAAALEQQLTTLQQTVSQINAAAQAPDASDPLLHTAAFPTSPPNLAVASLVLSSATASGVNTGPLEATTQGSEKLGSNTYRTETMNVTITGTLPQVLNFFDRVSHGGIRTLVFDNIQVEPNDGEWTVHLQLIVYAQPG
jgi:type II secretory pathway pseudopilin PulG